MLSAEKRVFKSPLQFIRHRKDISLSTYFPSGTTYFYGYPAGEDSGFLNKVVPRVEELVAARAFSCAGSKVSVVGFAATHGSTLGEDLLSELGIPRLNKKQINMLPREITAKIEGRQRNTVIKEALKKSVAPGHLVMAQPYIDHSMESLYQIPPSITTWLNDKSNLEQYIPKQFTPERYAVYANGKQFAKRHGKLPLPCVVKASASSAGDGVYICTNKRDMAKAVEELSKVSCTVLAEQHITAKKNYGVHFGIPVAKDKSIDIIGHNEQITSPQGEFLGGIINSKQFPPVLAELRKELKESILPHIRELGWYGIGCFDVLINEDDRPYIIDCNFRVTGMSAYHLLSVNNIIKTPLIGFSGTFKGTRKEFEEVMFTIGGRHSKQRYLQLIALSKHGSTWNFNAALSYEDEAQLRSRATDLVHLGIKSKALKQFTP